MYPRTWIPVLVGVVFVGLNVLPATGAEAATSAQTSSTPTTSSRTMLTNLEFENRLLTLVNNRRKNIGCVLVRANTALISAARGHTRRMASAGTLSHRLPGEPGLATRIERAGYVNWRVAGENIAWGASTPYSVYTMWMKSSGHRANIQNCSYRDAGIGATVSNGYRWVTLDLGRRR